MAFWVPSDGVADKYPLLVPPVYDKTALLTHETMRALWFEAGDALKRARRIISMGYSLPESDLTMKHFLRTAGNPRAEWIIVDRSSESFRNFRRLFGHARVRLRELSRRADCIQAFVATLGSARARARRRP